MIGLVIAIVLLLVFVGVLMFRVLDAQSKIHWLEQSQRIREIQLDDRDAEIDLLKKRLKHETPVIPSCGRAVGYSEYCG